ncbi:hypothetical protein DFH07DRAFT_809833 [Mycena maculata]|uniref:DUF6534 domain-containing protein n=1 Tax=Mycena maculata TaxID=230809 RepID=A0AAD7JKH8_9AGAR|nr:hypothetical protein DFH07DRAFT_809833 [Mycena maculata]
MPNHTIHHFVETPDDTLGAALIGFAVSCVVFGILLTQIWTYFARYNSDTRTYKILVIVVLLLEITDQSFIGHFVYHYTVSSMGNPLALLTGTVTWSVIMQQAVGSVVGTIVKCCFATRVYRFSEKNLYITVFLIALSLGQLGVALAFTVEAFRLATIPQVFRLKVLATTSLGMGALTDVLTALALWFYIRRLRTGFKDVDSLVRGLVSEAVNTGALTTVVSLATLLLFNFLPTNFIFGSTYFLLSKLYAVSFVATLNTRRVVRGRGTDHETERNATTREQQETNMFQLGTRMPTLHEADEPYAMDAYPGFDLKPGFPPEPVRNYTPEFYAV